MPDAGSARTGFDQRPRRLGAELWRRSCGESSCILRFSLLRFVDSESSGKILLDMRIPPLKLKIMLESKPLESRILVRRLAVAWVRVSGGARPRVATCPGLPVDGRYPPILNYIMLYLSNIYIYI